MTLPGRSPIPHARRRVASTAVALLVLSGVTGCAATLGNAPTATSTALSSDALWDPSEVHRIALDVDDSELDEAIQAYLDSGDKVWISADVVVDGVSFENVGVKLKGNSSLRGLSVDSDPATLPWLIRLDKYVDGQTWDGWSELVVRGNSSETSLNEAIALSVLAETDLAAEAAIASSFSVNDSDQELRLIVQNPDEQWTETNFADGTLLYKSKSDGTWDYVGDDPDDYASSFSQKAGEDDLAPIAEFMKFLNESDDDDFAAELPSRLDIEAFATYLAFQDLVHNDDDIDGPGNNSYLAYDLASEMMTVVNWDLNLAFGASPGDPDGSGGPGGPAPGADDAKRTPPEGLPELPEGDEPGAPPEGRFPDADTGGQGTPRDPGGPQGGRNQKNVLAERFRENEEFAQMIDEASARLQEELINSGRATEILEQWENTLVDGAGELVSTDTIHSEAAQIAQLLGIE